MFSYDFTDTLKKKVQKLQKKDPVLAQTFKKKLQEVIQHEVATIDTYKNLKSPLHEFKRIHLTDNFILLFKVFKQEKHILFTEIRHWDKAYK